MTTVIRLLQPKEDENQAPPIPEEQNNSLPGAISLLINAGGKVTSSRIVSLSLEAENATEMYISGDVTNVGKEIVFQWTPYLPQIDVYLSAGDGAKTITVKFRNEDKHVSEELKSQILLDSSPPSQIISISTVS